MKVYFTLSATAASLQLASSASHSDLLPSHLSGKQITPLLTVLSHSFCKTWGPPGLINLCEPSILVAAVLAPRKQCAIRCKWERERADLFAWPTSNLTFALVDSHLLFIFCKKLRVGYISFPPQQSCGWVRLRDGDLPKVCPSPTPGPFWSSHCQQGGEGRNHKLWRRTNLSGEGDVCKPRLHNMCIENLGQGCQTLRHVSRIQPVGTLSLAPVICSQQNQIRRGSCDRVSGL